MIQPDPTPNNNDLQRGNREHEHEREGESAPANVRFSSRTSLSALGESPPSGRRLLVLGSGTSTGVPVLGCDCAVCHSNNPKNQRTRPSVLMQFPAGNLLIDTTPEMRMQLLREKVSKVHAIAYTHPHADHLFGLDDARLFPKAVGGAIPIYCEQQTEVAIRRAFHYAFPDEGEGYIPPRVGVPKIVFERITPNQPFQTLGQTLIPLRLLHGKFQVLGFRCGSLAYCTDVNHIPEESWPWLENLETLILDALRPEPHPTHYSLSEALAVIERLRPRRAYLTHLSHFFDHDVVESSLPANVGLTYDGLTLDF